MNNPKVGEPVVYSANFLYSIGYGPLGDAACSKGIIKSVQKFEGMKPYLVVVDFDLIGETSVLSSNLARPGTLAACENSLPTYNKYKI